jgi:hypothetical protein
VFRAVSVARTQIPYRSQRVAPSESGAESPQEHERWTRCGCGMACLQMILEARSDPVPPIAELGRRCMAHGGYEERPARGYGPLIYAGFVAFVAAELDLSARVAAPLPLEDLLAAARGDEVVLASVSAQIREPDTTPERRGGHLVLVIDADGERLCFHDPAGAAAVWLDTPTFARFYAERGIAVTVPR